MRENSDLKNELEHFHMQVSHYFVLSVWNYLRKIPFFVHAEVSSNNYIVINNFELAICTVKKNEKVLVFTVSQVSWVLWSFSLLKKFNEYK